MASVTSSEIRISPSLNAYVKNALQLADSATRISGGKRILRIGDDSSSLTVANHMQSQTSLLRSTLVSGARATSFLQIAADGLARIRALLDTLDALADTANEAGQTSLSYTTLDAQFQRGLLDIDAVVAVSTFNGVSILDGSAATSIDPYYNIGATSGDSVELAIPDVSTSGLFGGAVSIGSAVAATAATTSISTAGDTLDNAIALVDAYQARLTIAEDAARDEISGVTMGIDALLNTDIAAETARRDQLTLEQQTAAALLGQSFALNSDLLGLLNR